MLEINEQYFDNINSREKAYFLGLLCADGSISKRLYRKQFYYEVSLSSSLKDREIVDSFAKATGTHTRIKVYKDTRPGKSTYKTAIAEIKRKHTTETLIKIFKGSYKKDRQMPDIPLSLYPDFIRGYFDGDGSLSLSNNYWELAISGNKQILERILQYFGFNNSIHPDKTTFRIRLRAKDDISKFLDTIYADTNAPFLNRKYEKAKMFFASRKKSGKNGEG